jgi:hypothetical protein
MFDLTIPGLCTTGEERLPTVPAVTGILDSGVALVKQSVDVSAGNPASSQAPLSEDDCWCCCSHIVPASHFQVAVLARTTFQESPAFEHSERGWFASPYHPPRL